MAKIYYCDAEKFLDTYESLLPLLSEERREKVNRLSKPGDKLLSALSGAMMKKVFGEKKLVYNEHGKPRFEHGEHFNLSHSGRLAVLAVSEDEIGVDTEKLREPNEKIMKRCFTGEEAAFARCSAENFTLIWTMKEAAAKLLGKGISFPLKSFSVLSLDAKHTALGTEIYFFTTNILGVPVTAALPKNGVEFEINEITPEELMKI